MKTVSILKMQPKLSILGLYSIYELDTMIFNQGYIPVASGTELNSIRTSGTKAMGVGTRWEGSYDVDINTTGKNRFVMVKPVSLSAFQSGSGWIGINYSNPNTAQDPFIFDGNELNITDLLLNNAYQESGLFGIISGNSKLLNIRIVDGYLSSIQVRNGLLAGVINNNFNYTHEWSNIQVSGQIENVSDQAGGVIGAVVGVSTKCELTNILSTVTINGKGNFVGGIIGNSTDTNLEIISSTYNGTINSFENNNVSQYGGIIGSLIGKVTKCKANVVIQGNQMRNIGSIVGFIWESGSIVSGCYGLGSVEGNASVGGLVGGVNAGTITNCYSKVAVKLKRLFATSEATLDNTGGLVAFIRTLTGAASIVNCYSTGSVVVDKTARPGDSINQGGLLASLGAGVTLTNSYWDTQTSGQATSAGGTGKTTTEMKEGTINAATIYVGWSTDIWDELTNADYPQLKNNYEDD